MSDLTRPARLTVRQRAWAGAFVAVGALLLLLDLGDPQVLPDELVYIDAGSSLVAGDGDPNPEHPPLAKLLFGLAGRLVGDDLLGARLVGVAAAGAIAVLLFWLVRRIAGNRAGLIALGLWLLLPIGGAARGPLAEAGRLDRFAMLDPLATALALGAVAAGWSWLRRPRWQAAGLAGLLGGLAAGAKPTGVVVLPAVAVVVLWVHRDRWPRSGAGVAVAVFSSFAGLAVALAPLGVDVWSSLIATVDFQLQHATDGHVVTVAGDTTAFPPWWSHLWFHVRDDGWVLTVLLWGGALAGLVATLRSTGRPALAAPPDAVTMPGGSAPRQGVLLLAAAGGITFLALAASPVKLPFYRYAWLPYLVALLAIALDAAPRMSSSGRGTGPVDRVRRVAPSLGSAVAVWVLAAIAVAHLVDVATMGRPPYERVAQWLTTDSTAELRPERQPVLLRGRRTLLDFYLDRVTGDAPDRQELRRTADVGQANAVVLDPDITSRFPHPADAVVDDPGWDCTRFDDLTLCLRRAAVASSS